MRTIVPFVLSRLVFSIFLVGLSLYGQPPRPNPAEQIERLVKKVTDGRETPQDRIALMNLYMNTRDVEGRRSQILWLTEHRPEIPEFRNSRYGNPPFDMRPNNSLPDAVGFDLAAELWRAHASKPDASPKVIANAAYFFRFADRDYAQSILKKAAADHPGDVDIAKMRGLLDVLSMGGLMDTPVNSLVSDQHARMLPAAKSAREDVDSSHDATLLGTAADVLSQHAFLFNIAFEEFPALGSDEALDLAERWAARAIEIEPDNQDLKATLARVYTNQGQQAADPRWKVQLLRKADSLIDNWPGLPQLAMAEYNAGYDDAAAKTVQRMLDTNPPRPNFTNMAHTLRGLMALDQKRLEEAKAELLESARLVNLNEPNRTLAQALMEAGERDTVLQYLEMCRSFWKNDQGAIDHYIKLVKAPGQHDIVTPYQPGLGLRGREAPKLPEIDFESNPTVAVLFRDPSCKNCAKDYESLKKITSTAGAASSVVDAAENPALAAQYEVETFPTVVLIFRGRINEVATGPLNEDFLRIRIERHMTEASRPQKLPAPAPIASEQAGTLAWSPVVGAESYVVQWDQRDEKGWISDRDNHLVRVIPAHETSVTLDPSLGETAAGDIRWRVFAVNRFGPGATSEWREVKLEKP
jgi:tetratricopeptide (TPR) repeat protein